MTNNDLRRKLLAWLMSEEAVVLVTFVTTNADLPPGPWSEGGGTMGLNVGWDLANPIPDLELGEDALSGTFSFDQTPHHVRVPWCNVVMYSLVDNEFDQIPLQAMMLPVDPSAYEERDDGDDEKDDAAEVEEAARAHLKLVN